jgi:hypothetical protein
MDRSSCTHTFATAKQRELLADRIVDHGWATIRGPIHQAVCLFLASAVSASSLSTLEETLRHCLREFGRLMLESLLNSLEPESEDNMPHDLLYDGSGYRRLRDKTSNQHVATIFGKICLRRRGYRPWDRNSPEPTIFPLEILLGLVHGVTATVAQVIAHELTLAGASQSQVISKLKTSYGLSIGVKRLRSIVDHVSEAFAEFQPQRQLEVLLDALDRANKSKGNRKPVLSVGRDGITLRENKHSFFEVATVATLTVFDRMGKRLVTVYLANVPQLGQESISRKLTNLIREVFLKWQGPMPTLCYVTDAGANESSYFKDVLRKMLHPVTYKPLIWHRVVDYYHASQRIWTMATCLFGADTREAIGWARRMDKLLKKPNGVSRVLHSAGSLLSRRTVRGKKLEDYATAINYLRQRQRFMRYNEFAKANIPLGSGITEAACKTIYTQRLKLSGMRWSTEGAERILTLRTSLLSGHWAASFNDYLNKLDNVKMETYASNHDSQPAIAA